MQRVNHVDRCAKGLIIWIGVQRVNNVDRCAKGLII